MNSYRCNLIVPGFPKSGTSSLHEYLDMHPQVCMSSTKEPHFFSIPERFIRGEAEHNSLFNHATGSEIWFGESSTTYSAWGPALLRIRQSLISPRFIVLLREPVERLLSHYRWMWSLGLERKPLLKALEKEKKSPISPEISRGGCFPWYQRCSNYSYFCELLTLMFGRENILYLRSEDLLRDPQATLDVCFKFLDLDSYPLAQAIEANKTDNIAALQTFGSGWFLKPLYRKYRDKIDPTGKYRKHMGKILGERQRRPQKLSETDLAVIKKELAEDRKYYRSVHFGL